MFSGLNWYVYVFSCDNIQGNISGFYKKKKFLQNILHCDLFFIIKYYVSNNKQQLF